MKNKLFVLLYLILLVVTLFLAYNFYDSQNSQVNEKAILSFDESALLQYKEQFKERKKYAYIWGFKEKVKKKNIKKKKAKKKKVSKQLQVKQKGSSLCVKKDCFRFLGIFYKKDKAYISLYNKHFKHKLQDFTKGEKIAYSLFVKDIAHHKVVIADKKSSRTWTFKLFDVNVKKYKPKDIK